MEACVEPGRPRVEALERQANFMKDRKKLLYEMAA